MTQKDTTDFGYTQVPVDEKQNLVREVFDSVASKYDIMNDAMSLGLHRVWKRQALQLCQIRENHRVLDVAAGTGDLSLLIAPKVQAKGSLVVSDINRAMLSQAKIRLLDKGFIQNITFVQANAETLPFPTQSFDRIIIGFGLRNVTNKTKALQSMAQLIKPGGRLVILEFSHPTSPLLSRWYDTYSFKVLPQLGEWIAKDRDSYQYLAESIRMHPNQDTLKSMALTAGFDRCEVYNILSGIVAIHQCLKY